MGCEDRIYILALLIISGITIYVVYINSRKTTNSQGPMTLKDNSSLKDNDVVPNKSGQCNCKSSGDVSSDEKLLPVFDPVFSFREAAKHILLLEEHLNSPYKRCNDCICKHFTAAEAYCEEAIGLDVTGIYNKEINIPQYIRDVYKGYTSGIKPENCAQQLRNIRKGLLNLQK